MSLQTNGATLGTLYAQESDEAFLVLLTVRHVDLAQPIRLTSDGIATVRSDGTYHPFPFRITLPRQTDAQDAGATLEADIVDRQIIAMLRAMDTAPAIDIEVIAAGDPEVPIVRYPGLKWEIGDYNELTVSGQLKLDDFADEPLTAAFTPSRFQALFRS